MKICVPIKAKTVREAGNKMRKALRYGDKIDFIELWLDRLAAGGVQDDTPVIAVCRAANEKGDFHGSEEQRIEVLKEAVKAGAKFVDVGIHTSPRLLADLKKTCRLHCVKMIVSKHFLENTPDLRVLLNTVDKAKKLGADIVKIAAYAKKWEDNVVLFELTRRCVEKGIKIIAVGMGEKGKISRIGCPLLGSFLTYAALDDKSKTAEGQFLLKELLHFDF